MKRRLPTMMRNVQVRIKQLFIPRLLKRLCTAIIISDLSIQFKRRVYVKIIKMYQPVTITAKCTLVKCKIYAVVK